MSISGQIVPEIVAQLLICNAFLVCWGGWVGGWGGGGEVEDEVQKIFVQGKIV